MCQLLGMNCNTPTDICFSFSGFQKRGGATDVHADGWGIAFFEGKGVRMFLDPQPSAKSPIAELVRNYPIRSLNVIAHIRKATQGVVSLENTHPFIRELWGHYWIFAHNGNLPEFDPALDGSFLPVGNTDSELIFCWLLQSLRQRFGVAVQQLEGLLGARQREARHLAERLIRETIVKERVLRDQLTIHSDRGPAMRSQTVAQLLATLGIAPGP